MMCTLISWFSSLLCLWRFPQYGSVSDIFHTVLHKKTYGNSFFNQGEEIECMQLEIRHLPVASSLNCL